MELVDTHGLEPCALRCEGSSPSFGRGNAIDWLAKKRISDCNLDSFFYKARTVSSLWGGVTASVSPKNVMGQRVVNRCIVQIMGEIKTKRSNVLLFQGSSVGRASGC